MIQLTDLPAVNATLNSIALVLLVAGFACIRAKRVVAHRRLMVSAFCVSILFLITYLTYRFMVGDKRFGGQGWVRPVYFFILFTHIPLAALVPVLASVTLWRGWSGQIEKHRRIARITFPIWVYVSVTGVLVYLFLFRWFPATAVGAS